MDSDKSDGAENQQERLRQEGWLIGFVDGEGCFSIGFVRQAGGRGRVGYRTGYQVTHEFAVTQGVQSIACLEELGNFFGVGQVIVNRRYDNHREVEIAQTMNRQKPRLDLLRILRGHTPNIQDTG